MMMDNNEHRKQFFKLVEKSLSGMGRLRLNKIIRYKILILKEKFGLEKDEIHYAVISRLKNETIDKYSGKNKLSTFALNVVYNIISNLLRYYEVRENNPEIRPCEQISINYQNPEKVLIGKELYDETEQYFGRTDTKVLLGYDDRHSVAAEKNISYDNYCRRLLRKKLRFKRLIENKGYKVN